MKRKAAVSILIVSIITAALCGCADKKEYEEENETVSQDYVYKLQKVSDDEADVYKGEVIKYEFVENDNGESMYRKSDNSLVIGPVKYIYSNDLEGMHDSIFRIIDNNGLIGYVSVDGTRITESKFVNASKIDSGSALVEEYGVEGVYFINYKGERISEIYADAKEYKQAYAMVKPEIDSKWQLIDLEQNVLFTADEINDFESVYHHTTAVDENKSYIIGMDIGHAEIMAELPFPKISSLYYDEVAIVEDNDENKGVVSIEGETIIPVEYKEISILLGDVKKSSFMGEILYCLCKKQDGTYDTIFLTYGEQKWNTKVVE